MHLGCGEVAQEQAREVDQVASQVDQRAPTRQRGVARPGFVRPIGVVEHELGGVGAADLSGLERRQRGGDGGGVPVGHVDAERDIGPPGEVDQRATLGGGPAQRLLAEHRDPPFERLSRLGGV